MGPRITNLALETKSQTLNIDHVNNQDLKKLKYELKVNSNAYENYERNFLFNDKKIKNIWESYIKFIYDKSNKSK